MTEETHTTTQPGYRKITTSMLGGSVAGLIGWWLRTKVGLDDFPTEHLSVIISGLLFYFVPEKYHQV